MKNCSSNLYEICEEFYILSQNHDVRLQARDYNKNMTENQL